MSPIPPSTGSIAARLAVSRDEPTRRAARKAGGGRHVEKTIVHDNIGIRRN